MSPGFSGGVGRDDDSHHVVTSACRINLGLPPVEDDAEESRVRDKVMQPRNDYDREVFKADLGRVAGVDPESGEVTVDFDRRRVACHRENLGTLVPAYAVSVHKAQGAEFPAVITLLVTQHYPLLQRNLLITQNP